MWWTALSLLALIAFMAAIVVAIVDRGRSQAVAMGFIACFVLYRFLLTSALPYGMPLPTTAIIEWSYRLTEQNSPDPFVFIRLGHLLCALLLGYLGGRFAGWVYTRRVERDRPSAASAGQT